MAKQFYYVNAATVTMGDMICGACRQKIVTGQYRYYDKGLGETERRVLHHRACCADDAGWVKIDQQAEALMKWGADLTRAAQDFYAKWGVTDLSDLLDPSERMGRVA